MRYHFSGLFFIPLMYGLYSLGYFLNKAVETYKGISISEPPIPISTAFFIILPIVIFTAELILMFVYRRVVEE